MKFDKLVSKYLFEKKEKEEQELPVPFVIEITKDPAQSKLHNELGEIIIKLSYIRNKLKN
jgi:hypothetical protein